MTKAGEKTAASLLEHTIDAIQAGGEGAVKVANIAESAGVSVISLYHFYGNREGLIEAALAEMYRRTMADFNDSLAGGILAAETTDDVRSLVKVWSEATFTAERAPYRRIRARVIGSTAGRPGLEEQIAQAQETALASFADAVAVLQDRGLLRDDVSAKDLAIWTSSMVLARVVLEVGGDEVDGSGWNALTIEALTNAVLPRS
jgi:AcrR family transcriptional regulator